MNPHITRLQRRHIYEFKALLNVFAEAFEWTNFQSPNEKWLAGLLENPRFFVFAAIVENQLVGGLTAYSLQQYVTASELLYVYDLAVAPSWRRQGIGKKLMSELFEYCKFKQIYEVFVQADEEDKDAIAFYKSTGAISKQAMDFTYHLSRV